MFKRFKRRDERDQDPVESRFLDTFNMIKDFEPKDFKRWHESTEEMYKAYQKAKKAQTPSEKDDAEINQAKNGLKNEFIETER